MTSNESQPQIVSFSSATAPESDLGQRLQQLCALAAADPAPMAKNISAEAWSERPESLLYCLYKEKRFDDPHGCFFGLLVQDHLIAVGGVYRADFCTSHIAVAGVRTYTVEDQRRRFWHGEYLIPAQVQWAREQDLAQVVLSFNEESDPVMKLLLRAQQSKATVLGLTLPDIYRQLSEHPRPIILKNTAQRILKINLKSDFHWDYSQLEVSGEK